MKAIRIREWHPRDWEAYRDLRLRALEDAPQAFGSTAADARRLSEQQWRDRLAGRVTFAAVAGSDPIGLVSGIASDHPADAELISMWVDPAWRARGVGGRLVEAVLRWAADGGYSTLRLWVATGNTDAERLYARYGFARTGEVQPIGGGGSDRFEFAMARPLSN
ncbi:MAG TPA: GNAT family N-acetyltransferase [Candidatus Dormibacteraeota bacterium]|nr:GNAT family N-acetyltransferase [Candidatus Dormibacteraeota bacterium]